MRFNMFLNIEIILISFVSILITTYSMELNDTVSTMEPLVTTIGTTDQLVTTKEEALGVSKSTNIDIPNLNRDNQNAISHNTQEFSTTSNDMPNSCKTRNRELLKKQPVRTDASRLKKCCPFDESLYSDQGPMDHCIATMQHFDVDILNVKLYQDCIEDTEEVIKLEIEIGNPCNTSMLYSKDRGDILYVIQSGSLLTIDETRNNSYEVHDKYCLDVDASGDLYAIVCVESLETHLTYAQTILFTIFMIVSLPCLIVVSFFHFAIKQLRTVHGLSLGLMSLCLAIGFFLHTIAQLSSSDRSKIGYAVQYFMLSYFLWLLALCINVVLQAWIYLPRYITLSRTIRYLHFVIYFVVTMSIPLCIVLITQYKGLSGMPSYFYQAWNKSYQSSQRYFIPPVSAALVCCFLLLIASYFAFRELEKLSELKKNIRYESIYRNTTAPPDGHILDEEAYRETRKDAKCIAYLVIIITTTWIMEVITFYSPGTGDHLAFMEIINGMQGFFILMIFLVLRHRRQIIIRWWHDRGSHNVTDVEMENLKTKEKS